MALVDKNSLLAGVHGSIGSITIVHQKDQIIAKGKNSKKPKATPRRKAHRGKFGGASKWASAVLEVPESAAFYLELAQGTPWSAHNVAVADFMHGPVVEEIDLADYTGRKGETIRIRVVEAVKRRLHLTASAVRVTIRNLSGSVLEEGEAAAEKEAWVYVTRKEAPLAQIIQVEVTATDRPGNRASKTVPHLTRG